MIILIQCNFYITNSTHNIDIENSGILNEENLISNYAVIGISFLFFVFGKC